MNDRDGGINFFVIPFIFIQAAADAPEEERKKDLRMSFPGSM
jgi:hypothetical protein